MEGAERGGAAELRAGAAAPEASTRRVSGVVAGVAVVALTGWFALNLGLFVLGRRAGVAGWYASWRSGFDSSPLFVQLPIAYAAVPLFILTLLAVGARFSAPRSVVEPDRVDDVGDGGADTESAASSVPVLWWLLVSSYLALLQIVSERVRDAPAPRPGLVTTLLFAGVGRDSTDYVGIATNGYIQRQLVYFPLYPGMMRILSTVVDAVSAGIAVAVASGIAASILLWRWMGLQGLSGCARTLGLLAVLLYPYSFYLYGVVYSDALFLAATLLAFLSLERGRLGLATMAGVAATAARPAGVAVALGLTVLHAQRSGVLVPAATSHLLGRRRLFSWSLDLSAVRPSTFAPLASLAGLAAYMAYQWVAWGSPLMFLTEQAGYHDPGYRSLLKVQYFESWSQDLGWSFYATTTGQALVLFAVLATVPAVGRRFGLGYGLYVLLLAAMPALSVETFMGTGRYLIAAFPSLVLFGEWMSRRPVLRTVWLSVSVVLLGAAGLGFSAGYYIS